MRRGRVGATLLALVLGVGLCDAAMAQDVTLSLGGEGGQLSSTAIGLFALLTVLSVVPGLAIMVTCFPMIVTVLSILRQAIGLQQAPPNMLIVSLAMFLSYFVMEPVFQDAYAQGVAPYLAGEAGLSESFAPTYAPFRRFMAARVDGDVLARMEHLRGETGAAAEVSPGVLIPSFLLSEIQRAFQIGFLVFLPFMIIDLIVAAVLMSMGMMMVPPAIVSLPFKLAFFVIADGWSLIAEALVKGYL
ncbi:flagellar type III secretion system pore protein FliP [Frigidibacter sp. ROC022]|uniref:flagellar type III secretion system pore protein FliP n=1 Tax=Frigidibacter sp. ROC022 TaxID=2971796 RepID=UPI00215B661E|nr:flagellar type III secretion system pore protein FliP [Frigidibacter sp. ROC022]MCR8724350.1 flagellar type III secretion system pore protein FliP [Frigidibacter sp. ROC022]